MTDILLGDWGTSRLRLWHCRESGGPFPEVLAAADGPGIKFTDDAGGAFDDCVARLGTEPGDAPALIAGMAGADIGWRETPYMPCPVDWSAYADAATTFIARGRHVSVLPGLSSNHAAGYRDVLRGEDVQLLGAVLTGELQQGRHVVCLPGTHTKWALVDDGRVQRFVTAITGELFDVLHHHSVLVRAPDAERPTDDAAFDVGVNLALSADEPPLSRSLFAVRALTVSGDLRNGNEAAECLSGLLIATDVRDVGLPLHAGHDARGSVILIGEPALVRRYERVLSRSGVTTCTLNARTCTVRGLRACYRLREGVSIDEA